MNVCDCYDLRTRHCIWRFNFVMLCSFIVEVQNEGTNVK